MVTHYECDYLEATSVRWGLGLKARLLAAGWFAGAAGIPVFFNFLFLMVAFGGFGASVKLDHDTMSLVWLFAAIPISAAALIGFIFGCQIVDPLFRSTAWRAALRGALVAFFSYVVFIVTWTVSAPGPTDLSWRDSLTRAVSQMAMLFLLGFVLVGWLILIVGALAGWLLYRFSIRHQSRFIDVPGEIIQTANLWIAVAILIFVANCITLMLFSQAGQH